MSTVKSIALPLVAVLLVVLAWLVPADDEQPRPPSRVSVSHTTFACPTGPGVGVAVGQLKAGSSRSVTAVPAGAPVASLDDPSAWQTADVDEPGVVVQQRGRRSGAVGFVAGTAPRSEGGGLLVGRCPGVVDDAWLLGLGSGANHFSTLVLTNLGDSTAVVDLTLWGPQGTIDAVDADGVVVDPGAVRRIRLDEVAAGEPEIAVHVHRRRGSVSVAAHDTSTAALRGTEAVTSTRAPSRDQVVGGVVEGAEGRTLLLLNPGTRTARVDVSTIGRRSTFAPAGLQRLRVPAGALRVVKVPASAGYDPQAMRVTSDQPVAASVRMAPGSKDHAYAEAQPALAGPAVVPVDVGADVAAPRLVLTAPAGAATARVQTFDAAMRPLAARTVKLAAGTTREVRVPGKGAAYAVLTPTGQVVAAATYVDGPRLGSLAVEAAPVTTLAPQVRPAG